MSHRFLCLLLPLVFLGAISSVKAGEMPDLFPNAKIPTSCVGVNIHFTDAQPGELEMLSKAGFSWIRMDFHWESTEKTPGVYDFSAFDKLLASLDKFHIRALLILDYANPLYDGGKPTCSDEGRAAFAKWAAAAATHFRYRGVIWEIWNEPNGDWFWKPKANADDYAKLALTVAKEIHQAEPEAFVVGPAASGAGTAFIEVSGKAGVFPYWSGITVHPYARSNPENYIKAYDATRDLIKKYGKPGQRLDVMCGESGYSTTWPGIDEKTHGQYLARLFLFDVLTGVPLTIWYDWRDDGLNPTDQEHHFGIVHHDYHKGAENVYDPKPAYFAARTYSEQLRECMFKQRVKTDSDADFLLEFSAATQPRFAVWTTLPSAHEIKIQAPDGIYDVTSFDGNTKSTVKSVSGVISLTIDGGPQYLKRK